MATAFGWFCAPLVLKQAMKLDRRIESFDESRCSVAVVELSTIINDFADAIAEVDRSAPPWKSFCPGVGPYGEPQLTSLLVQHLSTLPAYAGRISSKRTPDVLIKDHWALELKIARPFGDNGREAENWSVNLLHPYEGHASSISDCLKLLRLQGNERRAVVVVGYTHAPPKIELEPLFRSFEAIANAVFNLRLGGRVEASRQGLRHPIHQQAMIVAWEVQGMATNNATNRGCESVNNNVEGHRAAGNCRRSAI